MKIFIAILIAIVIVVGLYFFFARESTAPTVSTPTPIASSAPEGYQGALLAGGESPLLDFVKADYDKAVASDKLVVLYFYANWCPICRAEFPRMQAAFNEISGDDVIAFRVNYNDNQTDDDEVALARQFGVGYQHTKVFVKNGQQVLKSPEGWDQERYLTEIAKYD